MGAHSQTSEKILCAHATLCRMAGGQEGKTSVVLYGATKDLRYGVMSLFDAEASPGGGGRKGAMAPLFAKQVVLKLQLKGEKPCLLFLLAFPPPPTFEIRGVGPAHTMFGVQCL